jgi:hypothetical protein
MVKGRFTTRNRLTMHGRTLIGNRHRNRTTRAKETTSQLFCPWDVDLKFARIVAIYNPIAISPSTAESVTPRCLNPASSFGRSVFCASIHPTAVRSRKLAVACNTPSMFTRYRRSSNVVRNERHSRCTLKNSAQRRESRVILGVEFENYVAARWHSQKLLLISTTAQKHQFYSMHQWCSKA